MKEVCMEIEARYQMKFLEIGTDKDHVHFLIQSIPTYSVTKIVTIIKSLTAREILKRRLLHNYNFSSFRVFTFTFYVFSVSSGSSLSLHN